MSESYRVRYDGIGTFLYRGDPETHVLGLQGEEITVREYLGALAKVLQPGGTLVLTTHKLEDGSFLWEFVPDEGSGIEVIHREPYL